MYSKNFSILFIFHEIVVLKQKYTRKELANKLECSYRTLTNYIQEVNAYLFDNFISAQIKVIDGYYQTEYI
jgi:transcriptional antiterminator